MSRFSVTRPRIYGHGNANENPVYLGYIFRRLFFYQVESGIVPARGSILIKFKRVLGPAMVLLAARCILE